MNKITYKTALALFFIAATALFAALPAAFYIYDPLQVFHRAWGRAPAFHKDMRQQAVGIIRNYEFDSVIIGTSMLENSSSAEASRLLGGEFVNISMSSSTHYERSHVLSYLLDTRKVRSIVYSLDYSYLSPSFDHAKYPLATWGYLYDGNPLNDFLVYFNDKFFLCLVSWSKRSGCVGGVRSLDRPSAWFEDARHASRFGGLDNWFAASNNSQVRRAFKNISNSAKKVNTPREANLDNYSERREETFNYLDNYVISHAKANPETNFYYIFPPYSRIFLSMLHQVEPERARLHEDVIRHIVKETGGMSNVRILGYEDQAFPDDISNYKDPGHYREGFNDQFFEDMRLGRHVLTQANVDQYLVVAKKKALAFDLIGLGAKIDTYLESSNGQARATGSRK